VLVSSKVIVIRQYFSPMVHPFVIWLCGAMFEYLPLH
jgi:hypothetical protein